MKGPADLLTLKPRNRIHFDDDCKTVWKVVGTYRSPVGYQFCEVDIIFGSKECNVLTESDSWHLVSQCPHKHISSPRTKHITNYKPPTIIQAR
jgi:hypothetical protein